MLTKTVFTKPKRCLLWLTLLLLTLTGIFLTIHSYGAWDFVLPLRLKKLALLLTVAYGIGVSTLLFQTLTHNPLLTPGILGFEALYLFLQTLLVFVLGAAGFVSLNLYAKFTVECALMMLGSLALFALLIKLGDRDLTRMILVGVVLATFFASMTTVMQRMLDPALFVLVQTKQFAQFTAPKPGLIAMTLVPVSASLVWLYRRRFALDVLILGRDRAIALGIDHRRLSIECLIVIALLVASATALVGPVSFFGLLVCAIVNAITPTMRHAVRLPMSFIVAAVTLVGAELIFERLLGMQAVMSVVIDVAGGIVFLYLLIQSRSGHRR